MNRSHILLMKLTGAIALCVAGTLAHGAEPDHAAHHAEPASAASGQAAQLVDGEVREVDAANGKLTIRHGPIPNLEMDAMTMVFRVRDPSMLERVRTGDRIRFRAERIDGVLTVTELSTPN